jgi:hypothetical protein
VLTRALDLAFNVEHALQILPPDYVRSIFGDPVSWSPLTCPPTELQLATWREWTKGLPALAHILIPAVPWKPPVPGLPFSDLLFRPSMVFRYPPGAEAQNPTPKERWFFINGICTDHNVVLINAQYLHRLFGRPLTVLHNFTRGILFDLAACTVGKEWDRVTESAAVAFPYLYAALKDASYERVILLAHSQGTILSAVILALLEELHPPTFAHFARQKVVAPERAVARQLAKRWSFERTMLPAKEGEKAPPDALATFEWAGYGRRQPEAVTLAEMRKLEMYCFANCASEMVAATGRGANRVPSPWIESYGNENDIVARLGVLANVTGAGSVSIDGDRYKRPDAWGHLLNAHYLYPLIEALESKDAAGGLIPLNGNRLSTPRLLAYLDKHSPPAFESPVPKARRSPGK